MTDIRRRIAPGRILIVDDNKVNRLLLGRDLEGQGHSITFAEDGREALDILGSDRFDVVLLDIMMPVLDGYQVLERLMDEPELKHIPVIITSGMDEVESVVKCIEMGAEDYLLKPINPVLLRARVNASLEKKRLRDEQQELIRRFATSEVAEELLATGFHLGGKTLEATAMFADIRSFTSITASQSPSDTIELLNAYYTLMFDAINGHGGIVNQIIGDGLMAIFGAPHPTDDHSERAVRAAIEMVELIDLFNQEQAAQDRVQIRIGIGIASGDVIAGYTGTQDRATYTCVGDTVNRAARLESMTKQLETPILIDSGTQSGLGGNIDLHDLGPVELKGKQEQVQIFSVLRAAPVL